MPRWPCAGGLVTAALVALAIPAGAHAVARNTVDRPDDITGEQVHVMYVLPFDGTDRARDTDGSLAASVDSWQRWLSDQTGGRTLKLDTAQGELDVTFVRLGSTDAQLASNGLFIRDEIERQLKGRGFDASRKVYAVYYDGDAQGVCGGGAWPPTLPGNVGAMYLRGRGGICESTPLAGPGAPPGYLEFAMIHEIMHTLGFVATCAPNHTRAGHTSDSPTDLMYAGDEPWRPSVLDLGSDDYFETGRAGCLDLIRSFYLSGNEAPSDPGNPGNPGNPGTPGPGPGGPSSNGGDPPPVVDLTAPLATKLKLKTAGAKVSYVLSEAATLTFTVEQAIAGRVKSGSCRKQSRTNRTGKKCTLYKSVKGSFTHAGAAGANSFRFTGRVRGKTLKPGSYRLTGVPKDGAQNVGTPVRATFRIVK